MLQPIIEFFILKFQTSENLIQSLLPEKLPKSAGIEISKYFQDGFGNSTRIDYGTGHEMAFLFFLNGLFKVGALEKDDIQAVGLKVFGRCVVDAG